VKKFYASLAALAIVLGGILTFNVFSGTSQAIARDCDDNAIVRCGAESIAEMQQKINQNVPGDLHTILAAYGLNANMLGSAKMGEARKDGTVVVNGEVVATNSQSIGRQPIAGSHPKNIGGGTYHESPSQTAFLSNSISAFVFFDQNGQFIAALLTSCLNPLTGEPKPKPAYKCDNLKATLVQNKRYDYDFEAAATATGATTITGYTFDFGDGKSVTTSNKTVSHTYEKAGNYTAKVTVSVKIGSETKHVTDPKCTAPVPIKEPIAACDALRLRTLSAEQRRYAYDVTYTTNNGAELKTADFNFGDGTGQSGVTPENLKNVEHTYAKAGAYTTVATLHFTVDGANKDGTCEARISTSPEMCPLNPTLPKDDPACAPCPIPGKEKFPKNSPECVTPPVAELPKTGPMDMAMGGMGVTMVIAAGYYYLSSRREVALSSLGQ
jgi:plastocyanin